MGRMQREINHWVVGLALASVITVGVSVGLTFLNGCGGNYTLGNIPTPGPKADNSVVRGVAVVEVNSDHQSAMMNLFNNLLLQRAYAASTASTVVTYNNAASVTFTINATGLVGGAFTGDTLSLGSFTLTALKDNNLKVCNPGGNTKCTQAILRVYNTGALAGFINTSDSPQYGAPVYTTGDNPVTALGLGSPGVEIEQLTGMVSSKHKVNLSDFSTTTFNVTSDFSNSGTGSYSMTYVVEYALAP